MRVKIDSQALEALASAHRLLVCLEATGIAVIPGNFGLTFTVVGIESVLSEQGWMHRVDSNKAEAEKIRKANESDAEYREHKDFIV